MSYGWIGVGTLLPDVTTFELVSRPNFIDDKHQDVANHPLMCSICCDVSFEPVITPCQHVFCRSCIESALTSNLLCPNDRQPLWGNQLRELSGLHEYIYDQTLTECPKCIKWTGPLKEYHDHFATCQSSPYIKNLEQQLHSLQRHHLSEMARMNESVDELERQLDHEEQANAVTTNHAGEIQTMQSKINLLLGTISSLENRLASMGPPFDQSYGYGSHNLRDLSRLISCHLPSQPNEININRLFNCIKNCYVDTCRKGWDENLRRDVIMLIATCNASNWFSPNQNGRFNEWNKRLNM